MSQNFTECRKWFNILDQIRLMGTGEWKMKGDCCCLSRVAVESGDRANEEQS